MSILKSVVYKSVIEITEEMERDKTYTGNGHHLAQRIAKAVVDAVEDLQIKKVPVCEDHDLKTVQQCARCGSIRITEQFFKQRQSLIKEGRLTS